MRTETLCDSHDLLQCNCTGDGVPSAVSTDLQRVVTYRIMS